MVDTGKYKDELIDDVESYISRRCEHYFGKMANILEKYEVGENWADLPEVPLRQYNSCAMIVAELQLAFKAFTRIRISNIADEEEQHREYNTQICIDMGR